MAAQPPAPPPHGPPAATPAGAPPVHHGGHATVKTYVLIGLILTIITAVEVAIFYIPQLASVVVPVLLTLSAAKFVIVVLFYMHLKFDHPLFSRVFFGPMLLAVLVVVSLVLLFKYLPVIDAF